MQLDTSKIQFIITKLDGRYKGHQYYQYQVTCYYPGLHMINGVAGNDYYNIISFNCLRNWCVQNFGNSSEMEDIIAVKQFTKFDTPFINEKWAYSTITKPRKIYFTTDAKVWFDLRWT